MTDAPFTPGPFTPEVGPKPDIDLDRLRDYRLERLRAQLRTAGVPLCLLNAPISLRYAIDFREYNLFQSHLPGTTLAVFAEGPAVLFGGSQRDYRGVEDYRRGFALNPFDSGFDQTEQDRRFADRIKDLLAERDLAKDHPPVAIERVNAGATQALMQAGVHTIDAEGLIEAAKTIKSADELACMKYAIAVAELGMARMQEALSPGITENQLWSLLHQVNIAYGGDWIEGRMLASGPRTNPWLQEATDKVIEAGELVAFDTDMVGPYGYCADISRTWLCGDDPTPAQRDLYRHAVEEVEHNIALLKPGLTLRDLSDQAFRPREEFIKRRYPCLAHGVGMSDEYPKIYYRQDWERAGYDGVIEAGMVICVESYTGSEHGGEGVKLEQMVLVTENGPEVLSSYPLEEDLM